jgi:3-oxoacyl-[acyl-carrier-protein] synthase III
MSAISLPPLPPLRSSVITGTGAYLPSRILTNAELEKLVDTTDEWIVSRTGIRERRLAAENETTSEMAAAAARQALLQAQVSPDQVDLIIVATCTPDTIFPSTACHLQHQIKAPRAAAFDLQAACSGFLYGLVTAHQFIAAGLYRTVLIVGAEKLSSIVNWTDRNTCVLFGDGAGAVLLQASTTKRGLIAVDLGADGDQAEILSMPAGGCRLPTTPETLAKHLGCIQMMGKEVYRHAVNRMNESVEKCLTTSGLTAQDIACLIPHQANFRIIESVAARLKMPLDQVFMNLDRYGNMSAACIPVALHEALAQGRLKSGDLALLTAFGGGLTWASAIIEV